MRTVQWSALCRSRRELSPELFLSCGGELRDVQKEFSEYVHYCYGLLFKSLIFIFSLSPCPFFLNLLFEPDSYSHEYLAFICKSWLRYGRERALQSLPARPDRPWSGPAERRIRRDHRPRGQGAPRPAHRGDDRS